MKSILKELFDKKITIKLPIGRSRTAINLSELSSAKLKQIATESATIMANNSSFQNLPEYRSARKKYSEAMKIIDTRNGLYPDL